MHALTVRQPWAALIVAGIKPVENRTRTTAPYCGPLAIHTSRVVDSAALAWLPLDDLLGEHELITGAVLGVVDLLGVHRAAPSGCCRPWGESGVMHWRLANPRPLPELIAWRGALGLWRLPDGALHDDRGRS